MSSAYRARVARQVRNRFETRLGHPVVWQAVCWVAVKDGTRHALIRPVSTEALAIWAKGVLETEYTGRTYEVNQYQLANPVDEERLTTFESWALEDIKRMELAQKYSAWS